MEGKGAFDLEHLEGLSSSAAIQRLKEEGYNRLPTAKPKSLAAIAFGVLQEPMFLMLAACGLLYFLLGDTQEALSLLAFVLLIMAITFFEERKTERALEALRDLSSPRALVVRDGVPQRIPGQEVVRDDLLILAEGDRVPADGQLIAELNLLLDESLLTGESVPVGKAAAADEIPMGTPGGEGMPFVFSGTLVVRGQGIAKARRTGPRTEMGKIGSALRRIVPEQSPLWRETRRVVRFLAFAGMGLCLIVALLYVVNTGRWIDSLLAGLALAMAILPEEMPVILTVFLALGAWRIAQKNVLTRHMPAVETLGAATVLCVGKTGTLTRNQMSVHRLYAGGAFWSATGGPIPEPFHEIVEYCILAGKKDPFDPMEMAISEMGQRLLAGSEHLHSYERQLLREYPLSRSFPVLSHVWRLPGREGLQVAAKGAPEAIADLCHLDTEKAERLNSAAQAMARDGLRVIGVARGLIENGPLPENQHDFSLTFLGLVGFADPVRPGVPEAMEECRKAGIRVMMITGDYAETAKSIAQAAGFANTGQCITGSELAAMDDAALEESIGHTAIFARVVPEQKLRIVDTLKKTGAVVAMTGDGVNDAPALKSAHIGIAMGRRGTDVAREAAALVLTDDDFSSIVAAVRMGRRIHDNIKKAMAFVIAVHVPIVGMALAPAFLGVPLIFMPIHIVFFEMLIDPACAVIFEREAEERNIMARPPRPVADPLFNGRMVFMSLLLGGTVLMSVLAVFAWGVREGRGAEELRTMCFITQIAGTFGLIFVNRSWTRQFAQTLKEANAPFWWLIGAAAPLLPIAVYFEPLRALFRLQPVAASDWLVCLSAGVVGVIWFEARKSLRFGAR